jgi:hypothetical protein
VDIHGVEQDFRPAVKLLKKSASAAEVPDPNCREMKDAPSWRDSLEYAKFKDYIWQNHSTINETGLPDISLGFQIFVQLKREAAF